MVFNPNHSPIANGFFVVSVSVSSVASAQAAGVGPFRGLFFITSTSFTMKNANGNSLPIDNAAKNATIWIQGDFISIIATATAIYGLV